jgi:hypothetical protein
MTRTLSLGFCAWALVACAAQRAPMQAPPLAPAPAPASESPDERAPRASEKASDFAAPPAPAGAAEAEAPSLAPEADSIAATPAVVTALAELDRAEALADVSTRDCAGACRALDSMRRSASHVCDLEPPPGSGRCQDARRRVDDARARIVSRCGGCPRDP